MNQDLLLSDQPSDPAEPKKRPFGVWFLTIWDSIFAGVMPIAAIVIILSNRPTSDAFVPSLFDLTLSVLLGLGVIASAVGTWRGSSRARYVLVVLVTIYYSLLAFNNYIAVSNDLISEAGKTAAQGRIFRSFWWIAINMWYFLGKRTRAFYE